MENRTSRHPVRIVAQRGELNRDREIAIINREPPKPPTLSERIKKSLGL